MKVISLTNIGDRLKIKKQLEPRLIAVGVLPEMIAQAKRLSRQGGVPLPDDNSAKGWQELLKAGLVEIFEVEADQIKRVPRPSRFNPLLAIYVLNLELTYKCLLACKHCSQVKFRQQSNDQDLTTDEVKRLIDQAAFMALPAVNMTGGEPLLYRTDILELISYAKQQGVFVRLNTNGWWGDKTDFVVGGEKFATAADLVSRLRKAGVTLLVTSLDGLEKTHDTRRGRTGLYQSVIKALEIASKKYLPQRILATNVPPEERGELARVVKQATGLGVDQQIPIQGVARPVFWGLGFKDVVDIGGEAADLPPESPSIVYDETMLADPRLLCHGLGFVNPTIIHVSPVGGVRSCNHAVGFANLGNTKKTRLLDILNAFSADPVSRVFYQQAYENSNRLAEVAGELFRAQAYKAFAHPCTAVVVLAHLIQSRADFNALRERIPTEEDIWQFNLAVANSLGLALSYLFRVSET